MAIRIPWCRSGGASTRSRRRWSRRSRGTVPKTLLRPPDARRSLPRQWPRIRQRIPRQGRHPRTPTTRLAPHRSMRPNGSPELALLVADPQRATELCRDEIPALLGALEQVRAALWIRMVRAAEPVEREAASAAGHELLTVPDAAAELRFTRGYVYEAVRRGELPAV